MTVTIAKTRLPDGSEMPVFGLGTWQMGEKSASAKAEAAALRAGLDLGVTLIDTAEMYGDGGAEEIVAEAIEGRRAETYLVSKVLPHNAGYAQTIRACEASLMRLGTDHLDLYLLHWRGSIPLEDTVRAFDELKRAGKIRRWGVSNFDVADLEELTQLSADCAANQVLYNLSRRGVEFDLLDYCHQRSIAVMAYSPIEQGRLLRDRTLARIAEAHGATPAQVALAFVLNRPGVVAIPKSSRPERIEENLGALAVTLTENDLADLDKAFPPPRSSRPLEML